MHLIYERHDITYVLSYTQVGACKKCRSYTDDANVKLFLFYTRREGEKLARSDGREQIHACMDTRVYIQDIQTSPLIQQSPIGATHGWRTQRQSTTSGDESGSGRNWRFDWADLAKASFNNLDRLSSPRGTRGHRRRSFQPSGQR